MRQFFELVQLIAIFLVHIVQLWYLLSDISWCLLYLQIDGPASCTFSLYSSYHL